MNVPQWTTTMPPVALTCLSGYLEKENIEYKQIDLNIEFYNYLFSTDFYKKIRKCVSQNLKLNMNSKLIDFNKVTRKKLKKAISIQRNIKSNINDLNFANRVLNEYLKVINEYFAYVSITLNYMDFKLDNIQTYSEIIEYAQNNSELVNLIEVYKTLLAKHSFQNNCVIGFSINNLSQFINSIIITKLLKSKYNCYCFIGGSYLTANYESICKKDTIFSVFDSMCLYDGEHAIKNIYYHYNFGEKLFIKNIITKENVTKKLREFYIEDIKTLPPPSYKGINFKDYFSPIKIISLPISRGCYGSCTFCSYNHLVSSKWREQTINQIISSIEICKKKYKTNYFFFSVATLSPNMAKHLSEELIKRKTKIYWASGIRMEAQFTAEVLELMHKAGCVRLDIGIESASQNVLDDMNKRVNRNCFERIINDMDKFNIQPYLYIIKNFPTEKISDWKMTIDFLENVKEKILGFSCYEFFLSQYTNVYDYPDKYGVKIIKKNHSVDYVDSIISAKNINLSKEDKKEKDELLNIFYKKNNNIFRKYGNSYIKKSMPLAFQSQMVFNISKREIPSYQLRIKRNNRLNNNKDENCMEFIKVNDFIKIRIPLKNIYKKRNKWYLNKNYYKKN